MIAHECATDLAERQRRAQFSSAERLALEAHLSQCLSCRTARQLLADFEQVGAVEPQDGAQIERLAALARARLSPPLAPRKQRLGAPGVRALLLAAALVLLMGSAAASTWWRAKSAAVPAPRAVRQPPLDVRVVAAAVLPPPAAAPACSASSIADAPASQAHVASSAANAVPAPIASVGSAAELLRQAGDAKRRGDSNAAVELYQKLHVQYPSSPEALLSHVSLGRLFAEAGRSRRALAEFDRYLSGARGGVLVPEALYGRARTLTSLGDRAEEARAWQRLLHDFPDSAYAAPARRRLAELE